MPEWYFDSVISIGPSFQSTDRLQTNYNRVEVEIMDDNLSAEELDILERFERGEWTSVPNLEQEIEWAREAARNTMNKIRKGKHLS